MCRRFPASSFAVIVYCASEPTTAYTVFEDTYVRVDPHTGGARGFTMFHLGNITTQCSIKNTAWHQFDDSAGSHQTRYIDEGTSNRLSTAFETTVAGTDILELAGGRNDDVRLPGRYPGFDSGSLFMVNTGGDAELTGLLGGVANRQLTLVNVGGHNITLQPEATTSAAAHRLRANMQRPVPVGPGGSASFVYVGGIRRWQLVSVG